MSARSRLSRNDVAAVGAEFALIVPLLVLFLVGIIDVGRIMWTWNRAEKATHMGARFAAVTRMADAVENFGDSTQNTGFWAYDFYTNAGIPRGDPIPESLFGGATCTSTGCTCNAGATCPAFGPISTGFTNTVARMQAIMPEIQPENVTIEYGYSGLGYSGDPYGSDVNPLITIRLVGMTFEPALGQVFGVSINLPPFAATMTMEDGAGAISN
jgi:hypothetical protein